MVVDDVTAAVKRRRRGKKTSKSSGGSKVVLEAFQTPRRQDVALFGRRTSRLAACLVDMFPETPFVVWPTFVEQLGKLPMEKEGNKERDNVHVQAFERLTSSSSMKSDAVKFVCNVPSAR